jgi:ribosomal subunit interface protein
MNISTKATNIELTPALRDYAEKRLSGVVKFTGGDADIAIEIGKTTGHHHKGEYFRAEANVITPLGRQYRAVSDKTDLYEAIDDVRNELVRELTHDKDRSKTLLRRGAQKLKGMLRGFRS